MKKLFFTLGLAMTLLTATASDHFITDAGYRQQVEKIFSERIQTIGQQFFQTKKLNPSQEESEALHFLYAYMPLADVTDYPTSFYLSNVRASLLARKEMTWGAKIPELLFRHFVLPLRVNNEPLDSARTVFYAALKDRVRGMNMYDAILEVNHWCHEHVAYQPADARTSSPLQTLRTATGRCGEESTFTVAALRAVGIPARQVYTPRWAHTDDNHAWVEAWADGKWYFLGACEPEAVLNLGWFNAPASRAMLMHTRAFGDYRGPEEVMLRTTNFTEINLTANYAPTDSIQFTVTDANGNPVAGAKVEFKIYNYAEFYTAVTKYADANGRTSLSAGCGDLLVWASKDGQYGYAKASFSKDKTVTITLTHSEKTDKAALISTEEKIDIVPPAEGAILPPVTDEMRKFNEQRLAYEDSIRHAYTATFLTREQAEKISVKGAEYIVKSRGNHDVITSFICRHSDNPDRALGLLATLSDKDLRDIPENILEDSYNAKSNQLSPRVEDEMITLPFKQFFEKSITKKQAATFCSNPETLAAWIVKNVRLNPDKKALQIAQTPVGAWQARMTDERSRDILFVDIARSIGIEAQKDAVTGKVQYKKDGQWHDVQFGTEVSKTAPTGTLQLNYTPSEFLDNPKYYNHFTIARIENGTARLLTFDEGDADMGEGATWKSTFKDGYRLDVGTYMLTSGSRMANGSVLASTRIFNIEEGKTTAFDLDIRQSTNEVSVIGSFNSESTVSKDGKDVSILSMTGRGYYVVGVIGVGQEPTNHALHDIEKLKDSFEKWGRPIVLIFEDAAAARKFKSAEFSKLPSTTIFAIDKDGAIRNQIVREMKLQNATQLPMFLIADTFNRVVFSSQGYTIGLGEQLLGIIKKL